MAATQPVRIGHPVIPQTLPQVLGFPHIKNQPVGILHHVYTGALGQLPEEILPQPLDERPWVGK
jgi:hypothetical protein